MCIPIVPLVLGAEIAGLHGTFTKCECDYCGTKTYKRDCPNCGATVREEEVT